MIEIDKNYMGEGIYRENILDHYKNPRNYGNLKNPEISHKENNPLCGDEIKIEIKMNSNKIKDIRFSGRGCAISQASASILCENLVGKSFKDIKKLSRDNVTENLGIELSPIRIKCAVLALDTLKNSIYIYEKYGDRNGKARD